MKWLLTVVILTSGHPFNASSQSTIVDSQAQCLAAGRLAEMAFMKTWNGLAGDPTAWSYYGPAKVAAYCDPLETTSDQ